VKEKKISLEAARSKVMKAAIHDMYKAYYGKRFSNFQTESFSELLNMIRLLKQKAADKEAFAKDRMLGEKEIEIFNRLEARGDPDKELYNTQIYERYLSNFVNRGQNMNKNTYRLPEMIKPNYVTPADVKKMIDAKYRKGSFNIKSNEELKRLYEVAENVFNNMEDPQNSLKTVSAKDYDRVLANKLYEISNNVGPQQVQSIVDENMKIEEKILNLPDHSTSIPTSFFKNDDEKRILGDRDGESEDETDTQTASETDASTILPEIANRAVQDNNNSEGFVPYQTKAWQDGGL
jgi:hypothetical protein